MPPKHSKVRLYCTPVASDKNKCIKYGEIIPGIQRVPQPITDLCLTVFTHCSSVTFCWTRVRLCDIPVSVIRNIRSVPPVTAAHHQSVEIFLLCVFMCECVFTVVGTIMRRSFYHYSYLRLCCNDVMEADSMNNQVTTGSKVVQSV